MLERSCYPDAMGSLIATGVHRRVDTACRAVFVTDDNPPDYDQIAGSEITLEDGDVITTPVTGVPRETAYTEGRAAGTNNTWHYLHECPDG